MNKLSLNFRLIKTIIDITKFNNTNSSYHRQAKKLIKNLTASLDSVLHKNSPYNLKPKLQWYMAEFIYSCEKFNNLLGIQSTPKQRKYYLLSGALIGMCDMIIDDVDIEENRIRLFKKPQKEEFYIDAFEKLYAKCYHTFFNSLEPNLKERTIHYYEKLFDAQIKSKSQFKHDITRQEVDEICKEKGGYSLLFVRAMIEGEMSEIETQAWFELGAYIQFCNDAQDLYKDLKKDLRTFATTRPTLKNIAEDIDKQKIHTFNLIKNTHFLKKNKDEFLLTLFLMGVGIIAKLHKYSKMCGNNYSHERLSLLDKTKVQSELAIIGMMKYVWPKALMYKYNDVDKPFCFEFDF